MSLRHSISEPRQNIVALLRRCVPSPPDNGAPRIVPLMSATEKNSAGLKEIFPYGLHWNSGFEWMWLCNAWTHIRIQDGIYRMDQGDFCLIEPGVSHAEMYSAATPVHQSLWFSYSIGLVHAGLFSYDAPGHGRITASCSASVPNLVGTLLVALQSEIKSGQPYANEVSRGLLATLANLLMRALETTALLEDETEIKGHASRLALDYLRKNYARNISLAEIARTVHLTPTHLATVFKRETGKTIGATLTEIRLEHAKTLLIEQRPPIRVVAAAVGFRSPEHFCRVFQRHENVAPSLYST